MQLNWKLIDGKLLKEDVNRGELGITHITNILKKYLKVLAYKKYIVKNVKNTKNISKYKNI